MNKEQVTGFSEKAVAPHSSTLPGRSGGRRSPVRSRLWGRTESDTAEVTRWQQQGFPGGSVVTDPPGSAGDTGSVPGPGSSHVLWSS